MQISRKNKHTIVPFRRASRIQILTLLLFIFFPANSFSQKKRTIDRIIETGYQLLETDRDSALILANKSLSISKNDHYLFGEAESHTLIGRVYRRTGDYIAAIDHYLKALTLFEQLNDHVKTASVNNSIGIIYMRLNDYNKVIQYEKEALAEIRQAGIISHTDSMQFVNFYNQLGAASYELKDYDAAFGFFKNALFYAEGLNDLSGIDIANDNISRIYLFRHDYDNALKYVMKGYKRRMSDEHSEDAGYFMINLSSIYGEMGKYDLCITYVKKALQIAESIRNYEMMVSCLSILYEAYGKKEDYKNAFLYQSRYLKLNDSFVNISTNEKIVQMETMYQAEKRKHENELLLMQNNIKEKDLQQVSRISNYLFAGCLLLLLLAMVIIHYLLKSRRANRQLQKLNTEKNNVMTVLSHDMRSPFLKINTFLQLQKQRNKDSNEFSSIKGIVDEGMNMLNNILDVSYLEDKTPTAHASEIDLLELMQLCIEENTPYASAKNIELELDLQMENIIIYSDRTMLRRIIDNLVGNAIKYSEHHSKVMIVVRQTSEHSVLFEIHDNGQGIREEEKPRLFKKYEKLSSVPTGGELSTGLGLYITAWLVKLLNGRIWCESEWKKGSVFYVEVPSVTQPTI